MNKPLHFTEIKGNGQQKKEDYMARAKTINVKIPTARVIAGLEQALSTLEANYASQEISEAKYRMAYDVYKKELISYAIANIGRAENFRTQYHSYSNYLNIDFDLSVAEKDFPQEPKRGYEVMYHNTYRESKKEITNAIRLLKMTDEETVNTSTYNAIAQYL